MRRLHTTALAAACLLLFACSKESDKLASVQNDALAVSTVAAAKAAGGVGFIGGVMSRHDAAAPAVDEVNAEAVQDTPPAPTDPSTVQIAPTMVIHNGQASVEVDKLDPAVVKLRQLAAQLGGYIANSSMSSGR